MKLDRIMIIGLFFLLISPINLILSGDNNLVRVGQYQIQDYSPAGIIVDNSVAYIAGSNFLELVSVNDLTFLFRLGRIETQSIVSGIFKANDLIYVASGVHGFEIINVTNVLGPVSLGHYYQNFTIWDVFVSNNIAYLPREGTGLEIINVTDPLSVKQIGVYEDNTTYADRIFVEGSIAYLGESTGGLKILDVSDPANPQLITHYNKNIYDVFVKNSIAYLVVQSDVNGFRELEIVNMTDPTTPTLLSTFEYQTYDIFVSQNYAYLTKNNEEVAVLDITNPSAPKRISQYEFSSNTWMSIGNLVSAHENFIYLCTGGSTYDLTIINQDQTEISLNEIGVTSSVLFILLGVFSIFISLFRDRTEKNSIDYYLKRYKAKKANLKEEKEIYPINSKDSKYKVLK
ncbi:MAG: LVIVD repeat-containing protein [Candidatus Hodarchaeales archaeon]|jgi:hypothetical protein